VIQQFENVVRFTASEFAVAVLIVIALTVVIAVADNYLAGPVVTVAVAGAVFGGIWYFGGEFAGVAIFALTGSLAWFVGVRTAAFLVRFHEDRGLVKPQQYVIGAGFEDDDDDVIDIEEDARV